MVLHGIRLIINIFDLFIYQRYLETFIGKRKTSVEFSVFLLIVCEVIGSAVNQLGINWLNFITMLVVLCIVISQYQAKLVSKAIAILLYMGVVVISEPIGYIVNKAFLEKLIKDEIASYYFVVFFMAFLQAAIIEIFCRLKSGKKIRISSLPKETLYTLTTIPLTSLISCFLLIEVSNELISAQTIVLCMCIIFTIIVMNYMIFLMIERYTTIAERQHEEEMLMEEIAYNQEYYADVERYQEQVQDIKHDMKNQLLALYDAAEKGRNDIIQKRLSEMLGDIQLAAGIIFCFSPMHSKNRKLDEKERKHFGRKARTIAVAELAALGILWHTGMTGYAYAVYTSICITAVFMIVGKIQLNICTDTD